jgi:hypothetical protein
LIEEPNVGFGTPLIQVGFMRNANILTSRPLTFDKNSLEKSVVDRSENGTDHAIYSNFEIRQTKACYLLG